jgi:DNA-binding transcriptional MerR regulator
MSMDAVPIGEAARQSGVKAPTIRYYEQIGLLPAPPRSEGNRRQYDTGDLRRLAFIRHARELGFEIDAIRALLALQDQPGQSFGPGELRRFLFWIIEPETLKR